jgi:hypothetical protein
MCHKNTLALTFKRKSMQQQPIFLNPSSCVVNTSAASLLEIMVINRAQSTDAYQGIGASMWFAHFLAQHFDSVTADS